MTFLLPFVIALALATGCTPVPEDPFFALGPDEQIVAIQGYPPERAFALYLQAMSYYKPQPEELGRVLAKGGSEVIPAVKTSLAAETTAQSDMLPVIRLLRWMARDSYYAVAADTELMVLVGHRVQEIEHPRSRHILDYYLAQIRSDGPYIPLRSLPNGL